jgi:hypothetical protein
MTGPVGPRRAAIVIAGALLAAAPLARAETPPAVAASAAPAADAVPLRLALALEAANGVVTGSFHNQLLGLRLDGRFSQHLSLGGYLGLGDLKGKDGRAHAGLVAAVIEYMAGDPAATVRYPLRFATGWLAANGPVARASVGLAIALGQKVDLVGEVASIVWVTNNQDLLSLGASVEVAYKF